MDAWDLVRRESAERALRAVGNDADADIRRQRIWERRRELVGLVVQCPVESNMLLHERAVEADTQHVRLQLVPPTARESTEVRAVPVELLWVALDEVGHQHR